MSTDIAIITQDLEKIVKTIKNLKPIIDSISYDIESVYSVIQSIDINKIENTIETEFNNDVVKPLEDAVPVVVDEVIKPEIKGIKKFLNVIKTDVEYVYDKFLNKIHLH